MTDIQPGQEQQTHAQDPEVPAAGSQQARTATSTGTLACQWCAIQLPAGTTVCPSCGSTGVPDPSMIVPDVSLTLAEDEPAIPSAHSEDAHVEWWNEDARGERETYRNSGQRADDPLPIILGLVGACAFCVIAGIIGIPYLAPVIEENIGIVIDDPADLRPIGGILGLLTGLFIGALGMMLSAPRS